MKHNPLTYILIFAIALGLSSVGTTQPALRPEIEFDRLEVAASAAIVEQDWEKALEALERALTLGVEAPPSFHYIYGYALNENKQPHKAREALTHYLNSVDRNDEHYHDALAALNEAEESIKKIEQEQERQRLAAEKKKAEERAAAEKKRAEVLASLEREKAKAQAEAERKAAAILAEIEKKEAAERAAAEKAAAEKKRIEGALDHLPPSLADLVAKVKAGDAEAMNRLGSTYHNGDGVPQDYVKAKYWLERAAEKGDSNAMGNLGFIYYHGNGVSKNYTTARQWFEQAADRGHVRSIFFMGDIYEEGRGVNSSTDKAIDYYKRAGGQNHAGAMYRLGKIYMGRGRYSDARIWYQRAAALNNDEAMDELGDMYHYGKGVKRSRRMAKMWYKKAAKHGNANAKQMLRTKKYRGII